MANEWKITLLFNSEQSGWSETYYTDAADGPTAQTKGLALFNIRQSMCPPPTKGVYLRVSAEGFKRRSRLLAVGAGTNFPLQFGTWNAFSDLIGAAGLATLYAGAADVQRPLTLRGLSDDCFDRKNPANTDAAQWRSLLENTLQPFLLATPWMIKSRGGPLIAKNPATITAWVNNDNTLNSTLTLAGPIAGLTAGESIIIQGTGTLRPSPGIMKVLGFGASNSILIVQFSLPENYTFTPGYTAYAYSPAYPRITSLAFTKFSHRNTGRPFGGSRGRRVKVAR